jgi:hypothetical protein
MSVDHELGQFVLDLTVNGVGELLKLGFNSMKMIMNKKYLFSFPKKEMEIYFYFLVRKGMEIRYTSRLSF